MGEIAAELSKARSRAASDLVTGVHKELRDLNMAHVKFKVSITQQQAEEGIPLPGGENYAFNNSGVDTIEFFASTNPGEPQKPLIGIASTGEISRFTLALKGVLSEADNIPVLVFDEIDIGVGGRSGEIIGKKLWVLSQHHQVICITHLPQIATFADAHYRVRKETSGTRTLTTLETLQSESLLKELATMLAGSQYTKAAVDNVNELIHISETWKKTYRKD